MQTSYIDVRDRDAIGDAQHRRFSAQHGADIGKGLRAETAQIGQRGGKGAQIGVYVGEGISQGSPTRFWRAYIHRGARGRPSRHSR